MARLYLFEYDEKRDSEQPRLRMLKKKNFKQPLHIPLFAIIDSGQSGSLHPCFDYYKEHLDPNESKLVWTAESMLNMPRWGVCEELFATPETKHIRVEPDDDDD